jgi:hypothetical protein
VEAGAALDGAALLGINVINVIYFRRF